MIGAVLALLPGVPAWAALLAGSMLGILIGGLPWPLLGHVTRWTLQAAVVGLGAGLNVGVVLRIGGDSLLYTLIGLLLTFGVGFALMRWLGVGLRMGAMISAGTGICGGSAIAAVAPAIGAKTEETSAALSTVFILNAVALLVFPTLGQWLALTNHEYAVWCALAIHDTSSVVGAAMARGADTVAMATTVKLARSLWIVPVALTLGFLFQRFVASGETRGKFRVPWFIAGFVAMSAFFTLFPRFSGAIAPITVLARSLLSLTLFLIGLTLSAKVWRTVGWRALLLGLLLWLVVGVGTLLAIKAGWIG